MEERKVSYFDSKTYFQLTFVSALEALFLLILFQLNNDAISVKRSPTVQMNFYGNLALLA